MEVRKIGKKKPQGHYCKVCGQRKSNESFSGKGHANHICKTCSRLSPAEQAEAMTINRFMDLPYRRLTEGERNWLKNRTKDTREEYGRFIITTLSKNLSHRYGNGYSRAALFRMIQFHDVFSDMEKVATLSRQLTWLHFLEIIPIEDELKKTFMRPYARKSVRTLRERKNSMLYERTVISRKPEETIANEIQELREQDKMSVDMFYRDPYILDFLGLKDTFSEKDLESAILAELEKFILEMGSDFAFMARQKRIVADNKDYKIDLLFSTED